MREQKHWVTWFPIAESGVVPSSALESPCAADQSVLHVHDTTTG